MPWTLQWMSQAEKWAAFLKLGIKAVRGLPCGAFCFVPSIVPESEEIQEWCKYKCVVETQISYFKGQKIRNYCFNCCLGQSLGCNNRYSGTSTHVPRMGQFKQHSTLDTTWAGRCVLEARLLWQLTFSWIFCFCMCWVQSQVQVFPFFMDYCLSKYETKQLYFLFHCKPSLNCFFRSEQSLQMQLMMDSGLRDLFLLWVTTSLKEN